MTVLLDNVNTNTTSSEVEFGGGSRVIVVRGDDFGGGTVDIEVRSNNDSRFLAVEDASFTADGDKILDSTVPGLTFRARFFDATSPVNVFVELI